MTDEMSSRPYRMRRRAEAQEKTRRRITESAAELHGTVGPSRTTISAVAARAGVRRSTVYRHFPDEAALFDACSAHWANANPPPDLDRWMAIDDPQERLRLALDELHGFYSRTERMLDNLYRDEMTVPQVEQRFGAFRGYLAAATEALLAGRPARGGVRRRTGAALGHSIAFATWKSLVREQQLSHAEAAELLLVFVAASASS
ncbi:MAG: hypothetical protein NVSMB25_10410 [Thermoleophilaceae bacterium]